MGHLILAAFAKCRNEGIPALGSLPAGINYYQSYCE